MKPDSGDYMLYDSTYMTIGIGKTIGVGNWWARVRGWGGGTSYKGSKGISEGWNFYFLFVVAVWLYAIVKSHRTNTKKGAVSSEEGEHLSWSRKIRQWK